MKYEMILRHEPNPDIAGYWEYPIDNKPIQVRKQTLLEMRNEFIDWRDRNGLGSGNIPYVYVTKDNSIIGRFSYNGRFWKDNDNYEEITVKEAA